jgi:hypothetical protein
MDESAANPFLLQRLLKFTDLSSGTYGCQFICAMTTNNGWTGAAVAVVAQLFKCQQFSKRVVYKYRNARLRP